MDNLFLSLDSKPFGLTIFLSIITFQIAYILFQWYYIRRSDYLYYIAYMVAILIFSLSQFEYLLPFKLFSQNSSDFGYYTRHSLPFFSTFLYYRFARAFLDLPIERPSLNRWVIKLEYLILVFAIISPTLIAIGVAPETEDYAFLIICSVVIISSGIIIYDFLKQSIPIFRFAMAGAVILLFGSIIMIILRKLEDSNIYIGIDPFLPLLICVIAELLTFTTGLSYKTHLVEAEKLNVERKLIEEFREKQRLEKEMYMIRDNIARDLHDDIGSALSNINIFSKIARKGRTGKSEKIDEMLDRISHSSTDILDSMDDIVWSLRSNNDHLQTLTDKMMNFAHDILTTQEIEVNFNYDEKLNLVKLKMDTRKNVYLIFKEAVNNIAKYSNAQYVDIDLLMKNDKFILRIYDNGEGFDQLLCRSGNGTRTMKERSQMLGGTIEIYSVLKKGTKVQLTFKINNIID